jgi:superfamily II DNA/RNA helicase
MELMEQVHSLLRLISVEEVAVKKYGDGMEDFNILLCTFKQMILGQLNWELITHLVVDEADLIFCKKEAGTVDSILGKLNLEGLHLSIFSATVNSVVEEMCKSFKKVSKIFISCERPIHHEFIFTTTDKLKHISLMQKMDEGIATPCLVFVKDGETAERLAAMTNKGGVVTDNRDNDRIISDFRMKKVWFLFTTDCLSRGMDFKSVKSVINYDFPANKTQFVHRVGRINRNGEQGQRVYTFYTRNDFKKLRWIASFLSENSVEAPEHIKRIIKSTRKR